MKHHYLKQLKMDLRSKYQNDFNYFATDQEFSQGDYNVRGLALPEDVLHKIYFNNSVLWITGIDKKF